MGRKKIFVSPCLLGIACRYDMESKPNKDVITILANYDFVCTCPEVSGGLPTPRKPSEISGDRVIMIDGTDVTREYNIGAHAALKMAKDNGCEIAILKSKSPSCGKNFIYDGTYTRTLKEGNGITAQLFMDNGITVIDETELDKLKNENNSK